MKNVGMKVEGNTLTLTIDLSKDHGPSGSGKTQIVASTEGNVELEGFPGYKIGVNCFKPLPKK